MALVRLAAPPRRAAALQCAAAALQCAAAGSAVSPQPLTRIPQRKDWLALVAVHSDAWLMAVAFYFAAKFDKNERCASVARTHGPRRRCRGEPLTEALLFALVPS